MYEPVITLTGHLGADPRHKTTANGTEVTDFRLAVTPRRKDRGTDQWADQPTLWFTVSAWHRLAKNCAESLKKGDRVVVSGELSLSTWKDPQGLERSGLEVTARTVGLDLAKGTASYTKVPILVAGTDPGEQPWPAEVDITTGEMFGAPNPDGAPGADDDDEADFDEAAA